MNQPNWLDVTTNIATKLTIDEIKALDHEEILRVATYPIGGVYSNRIEDEDGQVTIMYDIPMLGDGDRLVFVRFPVIPANMDEGYERAIYDLDRRGDFADRQLSLEEVGDDGNVYFVAEKVNQEVTA